MSMSAENYVNIQRYADVEKNIKHIKLRSKTTRNIKKEFWKFIVPFVLCFVVLLIGAFYGKIFLMFVNDVLNQGWIQILLSSLFFISILSIFYLFYRKIDLIIDHLSELLNLKLETDFFDLSALLKNQTLLFLFIPPFPLLLLTMTFWMGFILSIFISVVVFGFLVDAYIRKDKVRNTLIKPLLIEIFPLYNRTQVKIYKSELKKEIAKKNDLLSNIMSSNEEMEYLKESDENASEEDLLVKKAILNKIKKLNINTNPFDLFKKQKTKLKNI